MTKLPAPAMKKSGRRIRPVAMVLGFICLGLMVSLKGDFRTSHMISHDLITNPVLIPVLGIGLSYLGYGPFSSKETPTAGLAVVGFLFRLAGSLLLVWAVFLWLFVISMAR